MQVARVIAGEGMLRLVEAQYGQKAAEPVAEMVSDRSETEDRPRAALTFDDGPHATYTPMLLDGLRQRGIHATFFLMGKNIEGKEDIVKQMQKDGHLIGNHTYDHVQLDKLPGDQACQQILKTNNEIYEITGEYPMYLRPPYGAWPKNLELCVTMLPVFWDVDTLDWKSKNVQSVENIVKREVKDGSIILMHDSFPTSVEAALEIVDMLTEEGYDLVTVDELLVT
ncbi:polysaccharide deacetylase family protein [Blautia sp. MSJ-36]|nr:polysaccharide deacetylase family protein [Blautia sp. MSJ-36]